MAELDHRQRVRDALLAISAAGSAAHLQRKGDVLGDGQVREQRVVLEDEPDIALVDRRARLVATVDEHTALARLDEAADHLQQRRLARARWPEQGQELALRDAERARLEGRGRAIALAQAFDDELRLGRAHLAGVSATAGIAVRSGARR